MKISINWLKDFIDLSGITDEEIIKRFTLSSAEIEDIEYKGQDTTGVVFARILEVNEHPKSDHLHILKVDKGDEIVQVVCGAPNVRPNMVTALATIGGKVQGHKITKAKLAGVESFGMCCSEEELGIGSDNNGIMDIDFNVTIGQDIKEYYPIDDTVFEIDNKSLTNRPDLWGHYGIARELSCIFDRPLKTIDVVDLEQYNNLPELDVKNENENCYRYSAIAINNVNAKITPSTMKIRLNYVGMRDINLLTDMANYIMLELGQPMHTFDHNIVKGIRVIKSKKGTKLRTLEGEEHEIPENACVIADNRYEPVAIAGIKGGLLSGINDNTNSVLLESATFESSSIRKTSTAIGLKTDASLRYEKSLDPELTKTASARFIYLLKNIDKDINVTSKYTDCYTTKYPSIVINISKEFIEKRIGISIEKSEMERIFRGLGFSFVEENNNYAITIPSFRATKDISLREDVIEEVARMYGYDRIVEKSCEFPLQPVRLDREHYMEYETKKFLAEKYDINEVHSHIWNFENFNDEYGIKSPSYVGLMDSSNSGQTGLRSELLPTLLKFLVENKNSFDDVRISEIGRVVSGIQNQYAVEEKHMAILLASSIKSEKELYFECKEIVEDLCANLLQTKLEYITDSKTLQYMHPINSCSLCNGDTRVGYMGVINPIINIDKKINIAMIEVNFSLLCGLERVAKKIKDISKYQDVNIDLNFLVDKNTTYSEIESVINKYKTKLDMTYELKDIYESEKLNGKKSMTFAFNISSLNKTLTSQDIEKFTNNLVKHMADNNMELRS